MTDITVEYSEQIDALAKALAKALNELDDPVKTAEGFEQRYKFAEMPDIMKGIRPVLKKHDLCVMQPVSNQDPNLIEVTTIIMHGSGQWQRTTARMNPVQFPRATPAQWFGAAISYLRRYSICAVLGLAEGEDLDSDDLQKKGRKLSEEQRREQARMDAEVQKLAKGNDKLAAQIRRERKAKNGGKPEWTPEQTNRALTLVSEAENASAKDEVRTLFARAKDEGLLNFNTEHGLLHNVLRKLAEDLPEVPA